MTVHHFLWITLKALALGRMVSYGLVLWIVGLRGAAASRQACHPQWRVIKPDATHSAGRNNEDHWVSTNPIIDKDRLRVYLPGTYSKPSDSVDLLGAIAGCSHRTIGLSYDYHLAPDAGRNEACSKGYGRNSTGVLQCLENQHLDALWGGSREPTLWDPVAFNGSVAGRLKHLLMYLQGNFPDEGWGSFLTSSVDIVWEHVLIGGHSQGAGHAAYLAMSTPLGGAVLLSGPQDGCVNCPKHSASDLWVSRTWATMRVTAARHVNESAATTIYTNWRQMRQQLAWPADTIPINTGLLPLPYGAVDSDIAPSTLESARPYHCSMALDHWTPMLKGDQALYSVALWPSLFNKLETVHMV